MFKRLKNKDLRINGWQLVFYENSEEPVQELVFEKKITVEELKIYKIFRKRKSARSIYDLTGNRRSYIVATSLTVTADGKLIGNLIDFLPDYLDMALYYF